MSAKKSTPNKQIPAFWIVLGVIALAGIIGALLASRGGDSGKAAGNEFGTAIIDGSALPRFSAGAADAAVGTAAPTVTGRNFDADVVKLEADGATHMVVFLAHWCPHCNAEAPRLRAAIDQGVPEGIKIDIVATGSNRLQPNWPPSSWVVDMGIGDLPTLVDTESADIAAAFGLDGYPFIVELDQDLRVVQRFSGEQAEGFFQTEFAKLAPR